MIPPGRPPPLYRTPSPLAIRNYHTVRVLACPKATAGLIFFGLAPLWHAWEGQGKEMGGPAALRSPRAGLGEASPVFFDSVELVREHSPSGSNKSSLWLRNWNCLFGDVITDTVTLQNNSEELKCSFEGHQMSGPQMSLYSDENKAHTKQTSAKCVSGVMVTIL